MFQSFFLCLRCRQEAKMDKWHRNIYPNQRSVASFERTQTFDSSLRITQHKVVCERRRWYPARSLGDNFSPARRRTKASISNVGDDGPDETLVFIVEDPNHSAQLYKRRVKKAEFNEGLIALVEKAELTCLLLISSTHAWSGPFART